MTISFKYKIELFKFNKMYIWNSLHLALTHDFFSKDIELSVAGMPIYERDDSTSTIPIIGTVDSIEREVFSCIVNIRLNDVLPKDTCIAYTFQSDFTSYQKCMICGALVPKRMRYSHYNEHPNENVRYLRAFNKIVSFYLIKRSDLNFFSPKIISQEIIENN